MKTSCNEVTLHIRDIHPELVFDVNQQHDTNKSIVAHLRVVGRGGERETERERERERRSSQLV